jgi:steroid delta-isomerase-like uncharacterized protein
MSVEDNKAVVRRFIDEIFVKGSLASVDELVADDFVGHTWPGEGPEGLKQSIERVSSGLADAEFVIDDIIAEGDRVAVRLTSSATQTGAFMGLPPTGKRYTIEEIHVFRVREGQVVEHWHQFDQMGLMKQLGAMPSPRDTA